MLFPGKIQEAPGKEMLRPGITCSLINEHVILKVVSQAVLKVFFQAES